jgi:hypothetical protein
MTPIFRILNLSASIRVHLRLNTIDYALFPSGFASDSRIVVSAWMFLSL